VRLSKSSCPTSLFDLVLLRLAPDRHHLRQGPATAAPLARSLVLVLVLGLHHTVDEVTTHPRANHTAVDLTEEEALQGVICTVLVAQLVALALGPHLDVALTDFLLVDVRPVTLVVDMVACDVLGLGATQCVLAGLGLGHTLFLAPDLGPGPGPCRIRHTQGIVVVVVAVAVVVKVRVGQGQTVEERRVIVETTLETVDLGLPRRSIGMFLTPLLLILFTSYCCTPCKTRFSLHLGNLIVQQ